MKFESQSQCLRTCTPKVIQGKIYQIVKCKQYLTLRPPQSEFVPAICICGTECASRNAGKSNKSMFLYVRKTDIMLAKMQVISFQLIKINKMSPLSGT